MSGEQDFRKIAAKNPGGRAPAVDATLTSILDWFLEIEREWLLIIDGADREHHKIDKFLPNCGNVLITSRNSNMGQHVPDGACIEVSAMEEEEALSLLLSATRISDPSNETKLQATEIIRELCCVPLAVDQAGCAIASGFYGIHEYIDIYSSHRSELLEDPSFRGASKYGKCVYGTWDISLHAIKARATESENAKAAIAILQTFAFLHHQNITEEIFERAADSWPETSSGEKLSLYSLQTGKLLGLGSRPWKKLVFRRGIQVLIECSLIKTDAASTSYSMHPLVHSWNRDRIPEVDREVTYCFAKLLLSCSITYTFSQLNNLAQNNSSSEEHLQLHSNTATSFILLIQTMSPYPYPQILLNIIPNNPSCRHLYNHTRN